MPGFNTSAEVNAYRIVAILKFVVYDFFIYTFYSSWNLGTILDRTVILLCCHHPLLTHYTKPQCQSFTNRARLHVHAGLHNTFSPFQTSADDWYITWNIPVVNPFLYCCTNFITCSLNLGHLNNWLIIGTSTNLTVFLQSILEI